MKWLRRSLYFFFFLLGFLMAAHWDSGRAFVQKNSPFYQSKVTRLSKALGKELEKQVDKGMKKLDIQ